MGGASLSAPGCTDEPFPRQFDQPEIGLSFQINPEPIQGDTQGITAQSASPGTPGHSRENGRTFRIIGHQEIPGADSQLGFVVRGIRADALETLDDELIQTFDPLEALMAILSESETAAIQRTYREESGSKERRDLRIEGERWDYVETRICPSDHAIEALYHVEGGRTIAQSTQLRIGERVIELPLTHLGRPQSVLREWFTENITSTLPSCESIRECAEAEIPDNCLLNKRLPELPVEPEEKVWRGARFRALTAQEKKQCRKLSRKMRKKIPESISVEGGEWFIPTTGEVRRWAHPGNGIECRLAVDIAAPVGTPILAVHAGMVTSVIKAPHATDGFGTHVQVSYEDPSRGWCTVLYGHLSATEVTQGTYIVAGQPIGRMGNSGKILSGNQPITPTKRTQGKGSHLHIQETCVDDAGQVAYQDLSPVFLGESPN